MKLSLLTLATPDRTDMLSSLRQEVTRQTQGIEYDVEFLSCMSPKWDKNNPIKSYTVGHKRNILLDGARGEYIAFIDSDDRISPNYVSFVLDGISKGVDCCGLKGEITFDGLNPKPFYHSIKHDRYWDDEKGYYRYPNHLNAVKSTIAKQFKFPETMHGEDTDWATQIFRSGLIKTEHECNETIYFYDFISNK